MKHQCYLTVLLLSIVGAVVSVYATTLTIDGQRFPLGLKNFCTISALIDCNKVAASKFALAFGIPIAWLAFLYYIWMSTVVTWVLLTRRKQKAMRIIAFLVSLFALAYSICKGIQMIVEIHAICLVCVCMYVIIAAIILFLGKSAKRDLSPGDQARETYGTIIPPYLALMISLIVVFTAGYLFANMTFLKRHEITRELSLSQRDQISDSTYLSDMLARHFSRKKRELKLVSDAPSLGANQAAITVVEFSDFQCPYCQIAARQLRELQSEFRNQIKLYFIHYPLDKSINPNVISTGHKYSGVAARAAMYAYERGQFWQFHDDLFEQQTDLSVESIYSLAQRYGWNIDKFKKAIAASKMFDRIKNHIKCGNDAAIDGTPTIYINGRLVEQWQDATLLRAIIKYEMQN